VRFSRLFFVALSRRAVRQDSSDRAAASANSSHSTWRPRAAAGVIAPDRRAAPCPWAEDAAAAVVEPSAASLVDAFMSALLLARPILTHRAAIRRGFRWIPRARTTPKRARSPPAAFIKR
jgi:hypothetical protein